MNGRVVGSALDALHSKQSKAKAVVAMRRRRKKGGGVGLVLDLIEREMIDGKGWSVSQLRWHHHHLLALLHWGGNRQVWLHVSLDDDSLTFSHSYR